MSRLSQTNVLEPPAAHAPQRMRWSIVMLLMALCFISHMNRVSMSIAADERIMPQYGISTQQMGTVYSVFLIVYTLFMLPGGWFIDRYGVRVALGMMALLIALFGALTGLGAGVFAAAGSLLLWLIVVRSVMGFFTVPLHPASARAVGVWLPAGNQTVANGLITGAALLGIACTPVAFGALIDRFDWPVAFVVTATITTALGLLWFWMTRNLPCEATERVEVSLPAGLSSRSLILLTLSYAAIGYFQYLFFYWMHYYFDQVLALGKMQSRFFAGLPVFAMAITMPLGGWLSATLEAKRSWRAGRVCVAGLGMFGAVVFLVAGVIAQA